VGGLEGQPRAVKTMKRKNPTLGEVLDKRQILIAEIMMLLESFHEETGVAIKKVSIATYEEYKNDHLVGYRVSAVDIPLELED